MSAYIFAESNKSRPVLQRRSSISNAVQALLDGIAVICIAWGLVIYHISSMTPQYTVMILLLMGLLAVVYDRYGLYRNNANYTQKALVLLKAWSVSFLVLLMVAFLAKQSEYFSRELVLELYVLGYFTQLLLHLLMRVFSGAMLRHAQHAERVVIVGRGSLADYLYRKIATNPWLGEQVVGRVRWGAEDMAAPTSRAEAACPVLGNAADLPALIEQHDVRIVYIVTPLDSSSALEGLYATLLDANVTIHWVPDIFALRLVNHSVKEMAGIPMLTLAETPLIGTRWLLKGIEDIVLGFLITLAISPLMLLVAIAIKLDSPGPVFFRQTRSGWNGKPFRIWKFRSMYVPSPEQGRLAQARRDDPRVTRVGAFLRRTSLDELPQLFNVLRGDMSLVGPRPHAVQHDEEYSARVASYFARHNIKPGMTGLAQVRGFRGETQELHKMVQRIESDIEYINNWSLWLDLAILLRTSKALTGTYAY